MVLLLQYTLIFASVLILVALGGCFAEHSGVINLGLEGIMIMGALGGALAMRYISPNVPAIVMILGVLAISALVGMIYSCLLAVACINFKADQTLVGTALNLLGTAGATVIVKAINTAANPDDVSSIVQYAGAKKAFTVNLGSFEFSWFMLVTALLLAASYVLLYKTRFGLRLMACGEHPQAADSVGINVYKMRYIGVLISGVLGGIDPAAFVDTRYQQTLAETSIRPGLPAAERRMRQMVNLNFKWFMQTLLDRKDRMSMYSGLEVRVPFCDYRIAEYLYSVPWEFKDWGGQEKGLLREAMRGVLPDEVLWRRKSPYPKTWNPSYLAAVTAELRGILVDPAAPILRIIKADALETLLASGADNPIPWYGQLMTTPQTIAWFVQLNYWLEKYKVELV